MHEGISITVTTDGSGLQSKIESSGIATPLRKDVWRARDHSVDGGASVGSGRDDRISAQSARTRQDGHLALSKERFMQAVRDGLARGQRPAVAQSHRCRPRAIDRVITLTTQTRRTRRRTGPRRRWRRPRASSPSSVQRIWKAHGLAPHRVRSFKALQRSEVRREAEGHRRPLHRSAGSRGRAQRG